MLKDINNKMYEPVVFRSWSVAEILELLESYEESFDMTDDEIHAALVYAAEQDYAAHDGPDILQSVQDAHKVLTTH